VYKTFYLKLLLKLKVLQNIPMERSKPSLIRLQLIRIEIRKIKNCVRSWVKVNISLLQAVEAPRVARGGGTHITYTNG
jgi:hypothetical protein